MKHGKPSMTAAVVALAAGLLLASNQPTAVATVTSGALDECQYGYTYCCDIDPNAKCSNNCQMMANCDYDEGGAVIAEETNTCAASLMEACSRDAFGTGDPHFKTWGGDKFDYHGECDLVLLDAPDFGLGIGLKIHIRTTMRYDYSYIESAAIKIGDDVLEVGSWGEYFLNDVESAELPQEMAGSFPVQHEQLEEHTHHYTIFIGNHQSILLKNHKDFVSVRFHNAAADHFKSGHGLLGDFISGKKVARDGNAEIQDDNAFGQEWQVLASEPQLFQAERAPLAGERCVVPDDKLASQRRRLQEGTVTKEEAEKACAKVPADYRQSCVFDVMATGDLEMAEAAF